MKALENRRVAILATDGFEQLELTEPRKALLESGAHVDVIAPKAGSIKGWNKNQWGESVKVDRELKDAGPDEYDALLLPGGVMNPDNLRMEPKAVAFVKAFFRDRKPVAAICHGSVLLIEAGVLDGRTLTSFPSIKTDLSNAGAFWIDQEVVIDTGLVTSRRPDDIPAFNKKMIEEFSETRHAEVNA